MTRVRIEVHITGPDAGDFVTMTFPVEGEAFAKWAQRTAATGGLMMACHYAGLVARDELRRASTAADEDHRT